jgi:hypothetical protein
VVPTNPGNPSDSKVNKHIWWAVCSKNKYF